MSTPLGRGTYAFRIHGQVYHRSGSLHPVDGTSPTYSQLYIQLYILDGQRAVQERLQCAQNQLAAEVMTILTTVLERVNPYAAQYKRMLQVEQEQIRIAAENNTVAPTVTMNFMRSADQKRYNDPRQHEVAAIFVSPDGCPPEKRDIIVHPKDEAPRRISFLSSNIDPMVYPLLFPRGALGWKPNTKHNPRHSTPTRNNVTMLQLYAHRLAARVGFCPIFSSGKLFQQFVVDAYVRVESGRLTYIRTHQTDFRVDLYLGLLDHANNQADDRNLPPGKIVVLPSSFQGSPRAMQHNFQDAMAIVSKYGRPDLFITFTCNPRCKDI